MCAASAIYIKLTFYLRERLIVNHKYNLDQQIIEILFVTTDPVSCNIARCNVVIWGSSGVLKVPSSILGWSVMTHDCHKVVTFVEKQFCYIC